MQVNTHTVLNDHTKVIGDKEISTTAISPSHKTLEERATKFGGTLDLDGEYGWGEPVGREIW